MIAIRGIGSAIAQSLLSITYDDYLPIHRDALPPLYADRYLFCQGLLHGKPRIEQSEKEVETTYNANYKYICKMCDIILEHNAQARICVMGSESGINGSFDEVYADAKSLLHHYVETKRVGSEQQLICVAPWIIGDAGMTTRRTDVENLERIRESHPRQRFLTSMEVAMVIRFFLYQDLGYTTNVVIRMNGGRHT